MPIVFEFDPKPNIRPHELARVVRALGKIRFRDVYYADLRDHFEAIEVTQEDFDATAATAKCDPL